MSIFVHYSSGVRKTYPNSLRRHAADLSKLTRNYSLPASVCFVTYNTRKKLSNLEILSSRCNLHIVNLAKGLRSFNWRIKFDLVANFAASCNSEYILALDAYDMLIYSDPRNIVDFLSHYGCELLFCNTHYNHPRSKRCGDFERSVSSAKTCHLSAGGYFGRTSVIRELVESVKARSSRTPGKRFDDQMAWRWAHISAFPAMRVDDQGIAMSIFTPEIHRPIIASICGREQ